MAAALILCRLLHIGAAMLLWGGAAYGTGARRAGRGLCYGLWALMALTALGWLLIETAEAGDGWASATDAATLWALLAGTAFGRAYGLHLLCVAALGLALWRGRGVAFAAALALASLALVGHAAMQEGAIGWAQRANAALHLLAAGYWIGGLPRVLAGLGRFAAGGETAALLRFSRRGHWAVALVLATGIANTFLVLGHLPASLGSPYQALLVLKIVLVLGMVGLALCNRYLFVPRLRTDEAGALAALRRGTLAEIAVGAAVLALVSAFATFDPV